MARFESVWSQKGVGARILSPLGGLYAIGWLTYQTVYSLRLKKAATPECQTITIGNLIAGGSGKTPMTLYVAGLLEKLGYRVVVGVSGYGSPSARNAQIAPDGELDATIWGDEAAMTRWFRPRQSLVVGRDRVLAAELVSSRMPGHILLMDDGFQHLRLRQNTTIVLDAKPDNDFCMPAGPYREPRSTGLKRATLVVPNSVFNLVRSNTQFRQTVGTDTHFCGATVNLLCALARPERLLSALRAEGLQLNNVLTLPDHDPLMAGTLLDRFEPETPLLTSAKDWVKLRERKDLDGRTVVVCWYDVSVEPEHMFEQWLRDRLNGVAEQTHSG